jgi:2'-5' RNA ligase
MSAVQQPAGPDGEERLFFALWPDAAVRMCIATAAAAVALPAPARGVPAEMYHLTIAFVGAVPTPALERVRRIGGAMRAVTCTIGFDAYEYWPKPAVVVAAARTVPPALEALWQDLHRGLAEGGFSLRPKRLRPHVTLARNATQPPQLQAMLPFVWSARDFCLVRSALGSAHSVYTVLETWRLLDEVASS